jgi:GNAT superfamily N-acetyltransferase
MMCAVMGVTVAVELPKRDSFAGGVYANLRGQCLYGIFRGGGAGRGCRGGGPAYGRIPGWHLHPGAWGHGYASESAEAVLAHAFALGLNRVLAVTNKNNAASQAVARRIGMAHIGTTTDFYNTEFFRWHLRIRVTLESSGQGRLTDTMCPATGPSPGAASDLGPYNEPS